MSVSPKDFVKALKELVRRPIEHVGTLPAVLKPKSDLVIETAKAIPVRHLDNDVSAIVRYPRDLIENRPYIFFFEMLQNTVGKDRVKRVFRKR